MKPRPPTAQDQVLVQAGAVERYYPCEAFHSIAMRAADRGLLARHLLGGYCITSDGQRELARIRARRT